MSEATTLFTNVNVFDGTGAALFPSQVLVRGERIAVVSRDERPLMESAGCRVIDGRGATLMPGLVEAHAHLTWPSSVERVINAMRLPIDEHLLATAQSAHITLDDGFTSAYSAVLPNGRPRRPED